MHGLNYIQQLMLTRFAVMFSAYANQYARACVGQRSHVDLALVVAVRSQGWLGCYAAASLTNANWTDLSTSAATLQSCAAAASQRNFTYAAMVGRATCRGGNSPPAGPTVAMSNCVTPCGLNTLPTPGSYPACAATTSNGAVFLASAVLGKQAMCAWIAISACSTCYVRHWVASCLHA
jgi:hypothetical protein